MTGPLWPAVCRLNEFGLILKLQLGRPTSPSVSCMALKSAAAAYPVVLIQVLILSDFGSAAAVPAGPPFLATVRGTELQCLSPPSPGHP